MFIMSFYFYCKNYWIDETNIKEDRIILIEEVDIKDTFGSKPGQLLLGGKTKDQDQLEIKESQLENENPRCCFLEGCCYKTDKAFYSDKEILEKQLWRFQFLYAFSMTFVVTSMISGFTLNSGSWNFLRCEDDDSSKWHPTKLFGNFFGTFHVLAVVAATL